jgi:hypothetical protein
VPAALLAAVVCCRQGCTNFAHAGHGNGLHALAFAGHLHVCHQAALEALRPLHTAQVGLCQEDSST